MTDADAENTLYLDTANGRVTIRMRPDLAPKHVERIKQLARDGFYDGLAFHRVIDGFMAQTGCPQGIGTGGSDRPDLPAEFSETPHDRGACSMARTQDPNSANSQFYICLDDAHFLDGQYTYWGAVVEGMKAVDAIKKGPDFRDGVVDAPDKIVKMTVAADEG